MARMTDQENLTVNKLTELHRFLKDSNIEIGFNNNSLKVNVDGNELKFNEYVKSSNEMLDRANELILKYESKY